MCWKVEKWGISGKSDPGSGIFLGQKPPPDKDGSIKKISQIGPVVPEDIGYIQTLCYITDILSFVDKKNTFLPF